MFSRFRKKKLSNVDSNKVTEKDLRIAELEHDVADLELRVNLLEHNLNKSESERRLIKAESLRKLEAMSMSKEFSINTPYEIDSELSSMMGELRGIESLANKLLGDTEPIEEIPDILEIDSITS